MPAADDMTRVWNTLERLAQETASAHTRMSVHEATCGERYKRLQWLMQAIGLMILVQMTVGTPRVLEELIRHLFSLP